MTSASPRPFLPGSLQDILSRHTDPFLLVLWSLDCPPCRSELKMLGETLKENPQFDIVLIATDDPTRTQEAEEVLARYGLNRVENWIFGTANAMQLRYEIDPGWYGELPRTYFFISSGDKIGVSGLLQPEQIEKWLETISAPSFETRP